MEFDFVSERVSNAANRLEGSMGVSLFCFLKGPGIKRPGRSVDTEMITSIH